MPQSMTDIRVIPSVLDRLLDHEPESPSEPIPSRAQGLRQMKQSLRRDLEWLLNARQSSPINSHAEHADSSSSSSFGAATAAAGAHELQSSLIFYGLPDFSSASTLSGSDQRRISRAIETAVAKFEPRLSDVVVTLLPARETERALRFRIDARLHVEPAPEPVTFDTVLHIHSGEYRIEAH